MARRMARVHASEQSAYMSAPVKRGGQAAATAISSTSAARRNLRVSACSTLQRAGASAATPTYSRVSSRPGRSSAGSSRSGRLVAAMMNTSTASSPLACTPSTSASSWLTTRSMTPPESAPAPRAGASASISSKKITQGAARRARANTSRTWRSLSPMYMLMSSGPLTLRKLTVHSLATALASSVLPVPGGPYSSTPERCRRPPLKSARCCMGSCTVSRMARLQCSSPPTSSHLVPVASVGAPTSVAVRRRSTSSAPSTSASASAAGPPGPAAFTA
mmetsp:Transcript_10455/g.26588  ORF Transcript_10455/g.26588 Transcript_10455/m.26588 type:complete len:276 (-) Transcript_10455:8-835(-)